MGTYLSEFTGAQIDTYLNHIKDLSPSHNDIYHTGSARRAAAGGVAGLNTSRVVLNEHRPVCTFKYNILGKQLQVNGFIDEDMWSIVTESPAANTYASRCLTLESGTGAITAGSATIPVLHSISSRYLNATFGVAGFTNGEGGDQKNFMGFASSFSSFPTTQRVGFSHDNISDVTYILYGSANEGVLRLDECPIGRNLEPSDIVTIRLDTLEDTQNTAVVRYYVNGQKQCETTNVPTVAVYVGCGVFNIDDLATTESTLSINYFGFESSTYSQIAVIVEDPQDPENPEDPDIAQLLANDNYELMSNDNKYLYSEV